MSTATFGYNRQRFADKLTDFQYWGQQKSLWSRREAALLINGWEPRAFNEDSCYRANGFSDVVDCLDDTIRSGRPMRFNAVGAGQSVGGMFYDLVPSEVLAWVRLVQRKGFPQELAEILQGSDSAGDNDIDGSEVQSNLFTRTQVLKWLFDEFMQSGKHATREEGADKFIQKYWHNPELKHLVTNLKKPAQPLEAQTLLRSFRKNG